MKTILAIALGGALGSVARYGVNVAGFKLLGGSFPWATLFVNIFGSFLIGLLTAIFALHWQPSGDIKLFLITGVLGGFTTFSAFSLDFANLWEAGAVTPAISYALISVVASFAALFLALFIVRTFAA